MFGLHPDGTETPGAMDLVRLAIPRRVYTQSHIDYVAEVVLEVARRRARCCAATASSRAPQVLRHFTARFEPLLAPRRRPARPAGRPAGSRDCRKPGSHSATRARQLAKQPG